MKQIDLGLLFGGKSCEHEVSLLSAAAVLDNLPEGIRPHMIGIDRAGDWFLYEGEPSRIASGAWRRDQKRLSPLLPARHGYYLPGRGSFHPLSVAFPAMHGQFCEDGQLQGLLSLMDIPYIGCDTEVSAVCMNKALTKTALAHHRIPMARHIAVEISSGSDLPALIDRAESLFPYPMFVKPVRSGSSVGAGIARSRDELRRALLLAARTDPLVLIEQYIRGREIEVAILAGDPLTVSRPGELRFDSPFYDYDTKYRGSGAEMIIPAVLPKQTESELRRLAETVFRALRCRHLARVDFFLTEDGEILFNEINTLPGMTSFSMYPALLKDSGIPFPNLIRRLIDLAGGAPK